MPITSLSISLDLLDLRHRKLSVGSVGNELHFVTRLDFFQQLRIHNVEDHRHSFVHAKLLDRPMLDRDLLGCPINFCYLTYHGVRRLGEAASGDELRPSISAIMDRTAVRFVASISSDLLSLNGNFTDHSGFAVTWNKAREFEGALFAEAPQNFGAVIGANGFGVRVVMLHIRKFFHQRCVLEIVGGAGEYELVVINPIIPNDKLDLLAKMHL